jgi:hypothetical protein
MTKKITLFFFWIPAFAGMTSLGFIDFQMSFFNNCMSEIATLTKTVRSQ